jgi:adenylate kinase
MTRRYGARLNERLSAVQIALNMLRTFVIATAALSLSTTGVSAIGFMTQMSCASDYYAYCSQFQVGSKELRVCMRRVGPKLSKSCLNALIADGEVSKAEVEKRKQEIAAARNPPKQEAPPKQKVEAPKQKRTTLAKADTERDADVDAPTSHKKSNHEISTARKIEKLTLSEKTFVALKQREAKFIEPSSPADTEDAQGPAKDASNPVADPPAKSKAKRKHDKAMVHKHKTPKKSKASAPHDAKKSKTRLAEKNAKPPSASRKTGGKERLAKD